MTEPFAVSLRLIDQRPFVLFWCSRVAATLGYHMLAVAIGWTIYDLTGSAFDLGLVGLDSIRAGGGVHAADRPCSPIAMTGAISCASRRRPTRVAALIVLAGLLTGAITRDWLFCAVFLIGSARAFELPSGHSLVPSTVAPPLIAARHRGLVIRQPGGGDLRPCRWRAALCLQPATGLRALRRAVPGRRSRS